MVGNFRGQETCFSRSASQWETIFPGKATAAKRGNCVTGCNWLASALCNVRGLGLSPFGGDPGTTSGEE